MIKYNEIEEGIFIERPNRFIARVLINGKEEIVHVKNTGRCKEILISGTKVFLEMASNPERKTKYSLISAYKGDVLINIDSQAPNKVVFDAIKENAIKELQNIEFLKREVSFRNSRFDLYFESGLKKGFIEVKGVTLENDEIAAFPDAPTKRGTKHVLEMIEAVNSGYIGFVFFLIQMKGVKTFTPNFLTDPEFSRALRNASKNGVNILAYDSVINDNEIILDSSILVNL